MTNPLLNVYNATSPGHQREWLYVLHDLRDGWRLTRVHTRPGQPGNMGNSLLGVDKLVYADTVNILIVEGFIVEEGRNDAFAWYKLTPDCEQLLVILTADSPPA